MTDTGAAKFVLVAGTRVCDFVMSDREVDYIQGPLGSGKTRALCARIMRHAQQQKVSKVTGLRMSRWAIVRNTYPDLKTTTIRTWLEMFPEHIYGRFNWGQPPAHKIRFGDVVLEVDFLALDKPEDVRKLRSTEYTGIAFNELAFIDKELFDEASSRLRYPGKEHGGSEWHGVIGDSNAPDEDHWLAWITGQIDLPPGMTEEEAQQYRWPDHWGFHFQPAAVLEKRNPQGVVIGYEVDPSCENFANLPTGYYQKMLHGKTKAWIDSRMRNVVALVVDGSPVWPMFRVEAHVSSEVLRPNPKYPVDVGLDFGRQPAAIFGQAINQRALIQHELLGLNEGAVTFAPKVKRFLAQNYPGFEIRLWGDPKGQDKGQADERTAYDIFAANGLRVVPAPNLKQNMIATRIDAVTSILEDMHDGRPRFVLSPMCRTLKVAMAGRYHLEREETGELKPKKDRYSNPADALQYLMLGMGEGRAMIGLGPIGDLKGIRVYAGRKTMRRIVA